MSLFIVSRILPEGSPATFSKNGLPGKNMNGFNEKTFINLLQEMRIKQPRKKVFLSISYTSVGI